MWDEAAVQAIRRQEPYAMNALINKYSRLLWPIASAVLKNVGSDQDVEEVVADTFIYLWEHPDKFDASRGSLKTLLCVVTRSRAIDRYRELTRHVTISLEELVIASHSGLQEHLLREENRRELLSAVNALAEPAREILIRRYYHNQKPREIALALNLTVKQVDNSLYRSKRSLRESLTAIKEV